MSEGVVVCRHCGNPTELADAVSVWGLFESHNFERIPGATVDEVVANWKRWNETRPHPARIAGHEVDDMGPMILCPVLVLSGGKDLRRVGVLVDPGNDEQLRKWRAAVDADPDVARLLPDRKATVDYWWTDITAGGD